MFEFCSFSLLLFYLFSLLKIIFRLQLNFKRRLLRFCSHYYLRIYYLSNCHYVICIIQNIDHSMRNIHFPPVYNIQVHNDPTQPRTACRNIRAVVTTTMYNSSHDRYVYHSKQPEFYLAKEGQSPHPLLNFDPGNRDYSFFSLMRFLYLTPILWRVY